MDIKKTTEGLENFVTTDTVGSVLGGNTKPGDIRLCYGVPITNIND